MARATRSCVLGRVQAKPRFARCSQARSQDTQCARSSWEPMLTIDPVIVERTMCSRDPPSCRRADSMVSSERFACTVLAWVVPLASCGTPAPTAPAPGTPSVETA